MARRMGIHCGELGNLIEAVKPDMLQKSRLAAAPISYRERMSCRDEEGCSVSLSTWIPEQRHEVAHKEYELGVEQLHDNVEDVAEESQLLMGLLGDKPG